MDRRGILRLSGVAPLALTFFSGVNVALRMTETRDVHRLAPSRQEH